MDPSAASTRADELITIEPGISPEDADKKMREIVELSKTKPVAVLLSGASCGPCKKIAPMMRELAQENPGKWGSAILYYEAMLKYWPAMNKDISIRVPSLFGFKNGTHVKGSQVGCYTPTKVELRQIITQVTGV